jgi:hypothetical protein
VLSENRGRLENFVNLVNLVDLVNLESLLGARFNVKRLIRPAPAALMRPLDEGRRGGENGSGRRHSGARPESARGRPVLRRPKRRGDAAER